MLYCKSKISLSLSLKKTKLGLSCAKFRSSYASWLAVVSSINILGHLPFTKLFKVIFNLKNYFELSSIHKIIWGFFHLQRKIPVVFHLQNYLRSSSICKNILRSFCKHTQIWGCLQFKKKWGRLPLKKSLRSSYKFEVVSQLQKSVRSS